LIAGDDSCHRALQNYAKINKNKFHPELSDKDIVLIDLTCSGAKIEPGIGIDSRPPIVGDMNSGEITSDSQIARALSQLAAIGLLATDVDLVTIGMGGNDAKFAEIIQACLLPNILRKTLQEYPNPPGEIKTLVDMFASCKNIDDSLFDSSAAINALYAKEVWAQNKILQTFANARVIQADYPDILPQNTKSLSYCGGLRKEDIGYARGKVNAINEKIKQAKLAVAQSNPRLELASLQSSLGGNALCPANAATALANGVKEANLNAEIRRLLNLDGTGDAQSRQLIDNLVAAYASWKQCLGVHLNVFDDGADCDVNVALNQVKNLSASLLNYLSSTDQMRIILANLVDCSNENLNMRYDRSKGLFHPNAKGYDVIACNILAAHNKTGAEDLLVTLGPSGDGRG
jgi:lysophospholipase L1-like esterase